LGKKTFYFNRLITKVSEQIILQICNDI
jgi:hypothetical protein